MTNPESIIRGLLRSAGVTVNGTDPHDIIIKDERLYPRILRSKSLALGEAYMEGWWECPRVDEMINRIIRSRASQKIQGGIGIALKALPHLMFNPQTKRKSKKVARHHYNLGNDLFDTFLDPYWQYSCGYFNGTDSLDEAQRNKMKMICEKLELKPTDRLLDIGCGWGGLLWYAVENYGCSAVGVNISTEQVKLARQICQGMDIEIRNCDYRDITEKFDKIVSVGMFEHVGCRNYKEYMETVARCLKPNGIFLLHTIGSNLSDSSCDPWISRYIFPNSHLPGPIQVTQAAQDRFVLEDWHNFGPHYDHTLMCWLENFRKNWPDIQDVYGEKFRRMWEYYLQACAGAFRARDIQLWQIVFTPVGRKQPCCRIA